MKLTERSHGEQVIYWSNKTHDLLAKNYALRSRLKQIADLLECYQAGFGGYATCLHRKAAYPDLSEADVCKACRIRRLTLTDGAEQP